MPRSRSGRSSPSRPCSRASTARRAICDCRSPTVSASSSSRSATPTTPMRSRAPALDGSPARRGGHASPSGVKIAIGPPIADGFYYDFEFPEPISEGDLEGDRGGDPPRDRRGARVGTRGVTREDALPASRPRGSRTRSSSRGAEGDISLYTQGVFTDLCRGPHLQDATPIKAVKLTSLAGAYWRGDEHNTQLTRIYGTAFYSQADLDAHLERLEQARARDHRGSACSSTSSTSTSTRPARRVASEGHGALQPRSRTIRRRENACAATSR